MNAIDLNRLFSELAQLDEGERRQVAALAVALAHDTITTDDYDAAVTTGGTTAVTQLLESAGLLCPAWCMGDHVTSELTAGNYHHDGEAVTVVLGDTSITKTGGAADKSDYIYVKPALFVAPYEHRQDRTLQVEVQTETVTILELSVEDATELAFALVKVVDRVTGIQTEIVTHDPRAEG